jgi:nicotinamidase-related amidase
MHPLKIDPAKSALLVVDVQERLAQAMPDAAAQLLRNLGILLEAARRLHIPVVVSEQYPKGLGPTMPVIEQALAQPGLHLMRFDKLAFSAVEAPGFVAPFDALTADGRDQWLVTGMETHVCVYQSARGLVDKGARVHVIADAVQSRTEANRAAGLELCTRAGAVPTVTETVVFDLLGAAGSDDFKQLSKLIR